MTSARKRTIAAIACMVSLAMIITMTPAIAFGKAIYTDARAKALAKAKVGRSAIITEVEKDYERGGVFYHVDLIKNNKEYELAYKATNSKLVYYQWELRYGYQQRYGKTLKKATVNRKAKRYVRGARITSSKLIRDDGLRIYRIYMKKGSKSYKLEYNAKSGKLIEYRWQTVSSNSLITKYIGLAKAKAIAAKRIPGATIKKCDFEMDDGVPTYEVTLVKGNYVYEVVVHAKTGRILEVDAETVFDYLYD